VANNGGGVDTDRQGSGNHGARPRRAEAAARVPIGKDGEAPRGAVLPAEFYLRPTLRVARDLLGKLLVHDIAGAGGAGRQVKAPRGSSRRRSGAPGRERLAGRIVEVEAYLGVNDQAAHSYGGHRSRRNETMYGPAGRAYVYLIYGLHSCLNVVCRSQGVPEAVLIRALEPLYGVETMARNRSLGRRGRFELDGRDLARLCRGPGCLCQAFGIDRRLDGVSLRRGRLRVLDGGRSARLRVETSARIGVAYAGVDATRRWRFFLAGNPCVSGRPR